MRENFSPYQKGLPKEITKQIPQGEKEKRYIEVLKQGGGTLHISEFQVGFYKIFDEIIDRRKITQDLFRFSKKEHSPIIKTSKKGEYTLHNAKAQENNGG